MNMIHRIGAILAGILLGGIAVSLIQMISNYLYQPPATVDLNDFDQMKDWVQSLPVTAFLIVLASWLAGSFIGPYVARRVATNRDLIPSLIVWLFFVGAPIVTLFMLPHPWWMWPAGIFLCIVGGILGISMASPLEYAVATSRSIHAPIEQVFSTLAKVENFSKAVPGITNIEFLTEQKYGVGTKFVETRMMNGKPASTELEVTELVENESIRMVSDAGGAIWDTIFRVKQDGEAVQMDMQMDARPYKLFSKLMTPMILGMLEKAVGSDMDAVKSYCES